ncbi:MAG: hypothetical protein KF695_08255 [Simplicispira sp.]|nr:hypothetical protein [Simplicispira sp.]
MRREAKVFGWFTLLLGFSGIFIAAITLIGESSQASGLGCKAICGIALLVTQVLGPEVGPLVGGLLWLAAGSAFIIFGFLILKDQYDS